MMRHLAALIMMHGAGSFLPPVHFPQRRETGCRAPAAAWRCSGDTRSEGDWREFRARLVKGGQDEAQRWSHELMRVEPGALLLANPGKFRGVQTYFSRAVVLVLEHEDSLGTVGFMLNRKTPWTVGDVAPSLGIFAECPLYMGGPVGDGLQFVHRLPDVHGAKEIMQGVFYGGDLAHAAYLLEEQRRRGGANLAPTFLFFFKYCSWGPNQLAQELLNTTIGAPLDPPSPVWHVAGECQLGCQATMRARACAYPATRDRHEIDFARRERARKTQTC
jgi:putative transcriptional regulator